MSNNNRAVEPLHPLNMFYSTPKQLHQVPVSKDQEEVRHKQGREVKKYQSSDLFIGFVAT